MRREAGGHQEHGNAELCLRDQLPLCWIGCTWDTPVAVVLGETMDAHTGQLAASALHAAAVSSEYFINMQAELFVAALALGGPGDVRHFHQ